VSCYDGYKASQAWSTSPVVQRAGIELKRAAMLSCGAIRKGLSYEDYVDPRFAARAIAREDGK
jgi:hypothetical protein